MKATIREGRDSVRWLAVVLSLALTLAMGLPAQAFHFPWDQGHDTTDWDDPPPPGPCEGPLCNQCKSTRSPVYIATGHFIWTDVDTLMPGRPLLGISRTHNSNDPRTGVFGNGWTFTCDATLIRVTRGEGDDQYIVRGANGKRYVYDIADDGTIINPDGRFERITSNADGTLQLEGLDKTRYVYDAIGRLLRIIDADGNQLTYQYNTANVLTQIVDDFGRSLSFEFNTSGFITRLVDQDSRVWSYDYDTNGNLVSVTNPLGGVRRYEYAAYSPTGDGHTYYQLTRIVDESGVEVTAVVYNGERVSSYTDKENRFTYAYDDANNTVTKTDATGSRWSYVYDDAGQIVREIDPLVRSQQFDYDPNGRLVRRTDPLGLVWTNTYDALGRLTAETNPLGESTTHAYTDRNPQPVTSTSPSGRQTTYTYDAQLRLTETLNPDATRTQSVWNTEGDLVASIDELNRRSNFIYDGLGLQTSSTTPLGFVTTFTNDTQGNLLSHVMPTGEQLTYRYDALNRLASVTDADGAVVTFDYDEASRVINVTHPDSGATQFEYDAYGRLATRTGRDGTTLQYRYHPDNLLKDITFPDASVVTYGYDAANQLVSVDYVDEVISFAYTARGELESATNPTGTINRVYDGAGRLIEERFDSDIVATTRNEEGEKIRLQALGTTLDYTRDSNGQVTSIAAPEGVYQFTFDDARRRTGLTYPNGDTVTYTYDDDDRLLSQQHNGTYAETFDFEYDDSARLTRQASNAHTVDYGYDNVGRLASANGNLSNTVYAYDALSNRVDGATVIDAGNRLVEDANYTYTYNAKGYLTSKVNKQDGARSEYTRNNSGRLVRIERFASGSTTPDSTMSFTYGPLGRRWSKTQADGTMYEYVYDGYDLIGVKNAAGAVVSFITFGPAIDEPLGAQLANGTVYFHADRSNSVVAVTGAVADEYSYDAYGNQLRGGLLNDAAPFGYTGREHDADDLYYFRSRYYDPTIGRFLGPDPFGLQGGINLYAYANADPINHLDPHGEQAAVGVLPIAGGAAAADGPLPIGDAIAVVIIAGALIYDLTRDDAPTNTDTQTKDQTKDKKKGRWHCTAQCNVQQIDPNACCPDRTFGEAWGKTQPAACTAAKRVATQSTPAGCYSRHCKCKCTKR